MPLEKGAQLGPYRVEDRIGAGGMGEVYAATDTRLKRRVAIKILPASLEADQQTRARFKREAELLASLHHPHVCTVYDIGRTDDGQEYLVLELLQGETLQTRIRRGPVPLAQLLRIGSQMAEALAAAHRHGIVHRDLKPGNVMLTPEGTKLLDFGLAKPFLPLPATAETVVGDGPATGAGTLTGTLHYMAPEQVQGGTVDARTDIFAFGAVLHEMATGEQAFAGANTASVIAKILDHDPPPLSKKVPLTPPALDEIVRTCLAKDPERRWQSAQDVHLQLESLRRGATSGEAVADARARRSGQWLPWGVAAGAVAVAATVLLEAWRPPASTGPPLHVEVPAEDATLQEFDIPELSPDGRRMAYSAMKDGRRHLFVRDLNGQVTRLMPGTAGATFPFWAPDGQALGFFADGMLKRVDLTGGVAQALAPAPVGSGAAWGPGFILFSPGRTSQLHRISAIGGSAERLEFVAESGGAAMRPDLVTPSFLPDGDRFLATAFSERSLYVGSIADRTIRKLQDGAVWARIAAGHIVYLDRRRLMARPFDVDATTMMGTARVLAESSGPMSVLDNGTIAFADPVPLRRLTWLNRRGQVEGLVGDPGEFIGVSMSARGRAAALWAQDETANVDVWSLDIASGILSRLTSDPNRDSSAAWSPDEGRLAFTSNRTGRTSIFIKDRATGEEVLLHDSADGMVVDGWTPDGKAVVTRTLGRAVFVTPIDGDRRPRMIADTPSYVEDELHVSPDGQWVAFNSDESGAWEVYVAKFPGFTDKRQLSRGGGVQPLWRGDGRELFYVGMDSSLMSIMLNEGPSSEPSLAVRLFATNVEANPNHPQYAVSPDGQRFLMLDPGPRRSRKIHLLLNWLSQAGK